MALISDWRPPAFSDDRSGVIQQKPSTHFVHMLLPLPGAGTHIRTQSAPQETVGNEGTWGREASCHSIVSQGAMSPMGHTFGTPTAYLGLTAHLQ